MKKHAAQVLTVVLMAGILGVFAYRQRASSPAAPAEDSGPESAVWRMLDAARAGDPETYLSCYTGEMESLLRKNLEEMGTARFREYLAETLALLKGIAVQPPQMTSSAEGRLAVEYVYADRNETQQIYVRRAGRQWKIFKLEAAERIRTSIPYGTPVKE